MFVLDEFWTVCAWREVCVWGVYTHGVRAAEVQGDIWVREAVVVRGEQVRGLDDLDHDRTVAPGVCELHGGLRSHLSHREVAVKGRPAGRPDPRAVDTGSRQRR